MTQEQFTKITDWQKKVFPASTPLSKTIHLEREIEEIKEDIESGNPNIIYELSDLCFLIFGITDQLGFSFEDLKKAIDKKYKINLERKWQKPNKDGVVFHVKN